MNDLQERVDLDVALLDDRRPGWEESVDVSTLDISSFYNCVLGQLYGTYELGRDELFGDGGAAGVGARAEESRRHGFTVLCESDVPQRDLPELNHQWKRVVRERELVGAER